MEDENQIYHNVRNYYHSNKTSYMSYDKKLFGDLVPNGKHTELPLIPLELHDPKGTINRIRNLIIFS